MINRKGRYRAKPERAFEPIGSGWIKISETRMRRFPRYGQLDSALLFVTNSLLFLLILLSVATTESLSIPNKTCGDAMSDTRTAKPYHIGTPGQKWGENEVRILWVRTSSIVVVVLRT